MMMMLVTGFKWKYSLTRQGIDGPPDNTDTEYGVKSNKVKAGLFFVSSSSRGKKGCVRHARLMEDCQRAHTFHFFPN